MRPLAICWALCGIAISASADLTSGPLFPSGPAIDITNTAPLKLKEDPSKVRIGLEFRGDRMPAIEASMRQEAKSNPGLVLCNPRLEPVDFLVVTVLIAVRAGPGTNGYAFYVMCMTPASIAGLAELPDNIKLKNNEVVPSSVLVNWTRGSMKTISDGYGFMTMYALTNGMNSHWLTNFDQTIFEPTIRSRGGLTRP